jgi:DNA repair ATPase RecN
LEQASGKRDKLQNDLFNVYKGAPRTLSKAYKKATEALKMNEELTFSKEEINNLLPKELRRE